MNVRKGSMVAKVGEHQGRACVLDLKMYPSINLAKKANGLNARTIKTRESFPPLKSEIDAELATASNGG